MFAKWASDKTANPDARSLARPFARSPVRSHRGQRCCCCCCLKDSRPTDQTKLDENQSRAERSEPPREPGRPLENWQKIDLHFAGAKLRVRAGANLAARPVFKPLTQFDSQTQITICYSCLRALTTGAITSTSTRAPAAANAPKPPRDY